jgi:hypothetical protein
MTTPEIGAAEVNAYRRFFHAKKLVCARRFCAIFDRYMAHHQVIKTTRITRIQYGGRSVPA